MQKNSRHPIAQRVQLFKPHARNAGVEGDSPRLSLGDQKGVFSSEREYPLLFASLHGAGIYPASAALTASTVKSVHARSSFAFCSAVKAL